jgi:hypothetical protein
VLAEAGVTDDLVVHHTGHAGQRSRGASRLLDEPDAVWTLTRDADEGTGEFSPLEPIRYISVYGRDVEMQPESLTFDATTRALKLTGRGKAETRADQKSEAILTAFNGVPMTKAALKKKLTGNDQKNGYLIDEMLEEGLLTKVSKTSNGYFLMLPTIQMEAS